MNNAFDSDIGDEALAEFGNNDAMDSADLTQGITATITTDANGEYSFSSD